MSQFMFRHFLLNKGLADFSWERIRKSTVASGAAKPCHNYSALCSGTEAAIWNCMNVLYSHQISLRKTALRSLLSLVKVSNNQVPLNWTICYGPRSSELVEMLHAQWWNTVRQLKKRMPLHNHINAALESQISHLIPNDHATLGNLQFPVSEMVFLLGVVGRNTWTDSTESRIKGSWMLLPRPRGTKALGCTALWYLWLPPYSTYRFPRERPTLGKALKQFTFKVHLIPLKRAGWGEGKERKTLDS